jgi:predicted PhzF superfamily epimerase YddE/YHI9
VRGLAPDLGAIAHIARRDGIRGVIATAGASSPDAGYDFVSRFFAPADGIPEDPVTGSAHTRLGAVLVWPARPRRAHRPAGLSRGGSSARRCTAIASTHRPCVVVLDGTLTGRDCGGGLRRSAGTTDRRSPVASRALLAA